MANLQTIHRLIGTILLIAFAASAQACESLAITCSNCYQTYSMYFEVNRSWLEKGEYVINRAPTCTQPGTVEFKCYYCGTFAYAFDILPALGHDWGDATYVDPTCTTGGHDQHTCTRCSATETYNEVAALGHVYGEDHKCTRCSEDYGTFSYIGTNGQTASCSNYKFITNSSSVEQGTVNHTSWYAIYGDVNLTSLKFKDKVSNIILLDDATLTITATGQTYALNGDIGTLNIYGQAGGTGRLVINAEDNAIFAKTDANIYGGDISATSKNTHGISAYGNIGIAGGTVRGTSTLNGNGIFSIMGTLNITGGTVTATGGIGKNGMSGDKGINLSWANTATSITSNSYSGTVTLAKSFLGSDGNIYASGAVADPSVLNDVTLTGANLLYDNAYNDISGFASTTSVALYGRTIYRDGDWNTLCLPFPLPTLTGTPLEGFTVMELDGTTSHLDGDGTLYLNFNTATAIEAGKPYLVKRNAPTYIVTSASEGQNGTSYHNIFDGNKSTTWVVSRNSLPVYCEFQADAPIYVSGYTVSSNYLNINYRPTVWTLKAKLNENDEWTVIDSRNANSNGDDASPVYNTTPPKTFTVQAGTYRFFRLEVTQSFNSLDIEVWDFALQARFDDITNPLFTGITVSNAAPTPVESSDGVVSFVGSYSPVSLDANDKSVLYLGVANTLYYPNADMTLGSCRALFRLNGAASIREINLNFDDSSEATIISPAEIKERADAAWYSIDGRKLEGKPTQKGLYIYGNKKVVIK